MAQYVAEVYGVEEVDDVWQLSEEDVAAVVTALSLKSVSADKLKEAVKAAQVYPLFWVHFVNPCDSSYFFSSHQDKRSPPPPPDKQVGLHLRQKLF